MQLHVLLHRRFWALLLTGVALSALLSACAFDSTNSTGTNGSQNGYVFTNPNLTPPPTFPPVTIGAWMSNQTPSQGDTITLYVILRSQPADMKTAAAPIPNISVTSGVGHATTAPDGIAAISFQAGGTPGQPVVLTASASVNGVNVSTTTFYTCLPTAPPGTATPAAGHS